jgi:hypothetical protein
VNCGYTAPPERVIKPKKKGAIRAGVTQEQLGKSMGRFIEREMKVRAGGNGQAFHVVGSIPQAVKGKRSEAEKFGKTKHAPGRGGRVGMR